MTDQQLKISRPPAGRPTKKQQAERQRQLLRVALDDFLEHGFDEASVEGIAAKVGMSKRTIYARYKDKDALFLATIAKAAERYTVSLEKLAEAEGDSLRDTLLNVARLRLFNVSQPEAIKLQRVLTAQSYRFPSAFQDFFAESIAPTIAFVERHLEENMSEGTVTIKDLRRTATAFLSLVVGGPARTIIAGAPLKPAEVERHINFAVDLFLNGILVRRSA
ncbi:TetR/AcrR family transcriptional regulator [Croceicoccus hydrothermalis]|uniref:TetR/AcrR family transcriptional regulator n=1 Tax=Croceicoccus hydrothermalis TaxID=2867964 RepID=UPI001EFB7499|nr:TetR/AcrR family transcriptional regulator [Croceicoccus hydrothermalis]